MIKRTSQMVLGVLVSGALVTALATPAPAQAGEGFFELFGGLTLIGGDVVLPCGQVSIPECGGDINIPDVKADFDDDTPTFGLAGGYRSSDKLGFKASLSWIDGDDTFGAPFEGSPLEIDVFFIDLSVMYFPKGKRFYIYGGPGLVDVEARVDIGGAELTGDEQTGTVHAGFGSQFNFGEKAYFRLQSKARWVDSDVYDDIDFESTVGIGFRFGG